MNMNMNVRGGGGGGGVGSSFTCHSHSHHPASSTHTPTHQNKVQGITDSSIVKKENTTQYCSLERAKGHGQTIKQTQRMRRSAPRIQNKRKRSLHAGTTTHHCVSSLLSGERRALKDMCAGTRRPYSPATVVPPNTKKTASVALTRPTTAKPPGGMESCLDTFTAVSVARIHTHTHTKGC